MDGPLPGFKVILSRQKIQTAVETDKFTKEGQCLTLFATEMSKIWIGKTLLRTKHS
jgi:hypothetical protein